MRKLDHSPLGGIEREKVEAAKMEGQANMIKAMNEASTKSQEAKILMEDMLGMDPLARACHEIYRERIDKEVLAAEEDSVSTFI
jgi:hypothetical protein